MEKEKWSHILISSMNKGCQEQAAYKREKRIIEMDRRIFAEQVTERGRRRHDL